jgi:hypothetical protein
LDDAPTVSDIRYFLFMNITNHQYDDAIDELNIAVPTLEGQVYTVDASVKSTSRTYAGSVNVTYQLKDKIDIATIFDQNLSTTLREDDLLNLNQTSINNYFLNLIFNQYTTDGINVN